MASKLTVLYDACVLYPNYLSDRFPITPHQGRLAFSRYVLPDSL
jgi:hypothetical protein